MQTEVGNCDPPDIAGLGFIAFFASGYASEARWEMTHGTSGHPSHNCPPRYIKSCTEIMQAIFIKSQSWKQMYVQCSLEQLPRVGTSLCCRRRYVSVTISNIIINCRVDGLCQAMSHCKGYVTNEHYSNWIHQWP